MASVAEYRHRVSIQTRVEASDGHDGWIDTWPTTVQRRIPARVLPLQGRELERARQIDARIAYEITLPYWRAYRADLKGGRARAIYHLSSKASEDRTFEIVSPPVDVEERHLEIQVLCREET